MPSRRLPALVLVAYLLHQISWVISQSTKVYSRVAANHSYHEFGFLFQQLVLCCYLRRLTRYHLGSLSTEETDQCLSCQSTDLQSEKGNWSGFKAR